MKKNAASKRRIVPLWRLLWQSAPWRIWQMSRVCLSVQFDKYKNFNLAQWHFISMMLIIPKEQADRGHMHFDPRPSCIVYTATVVAASRQIPNKTLNFLFFVLC